VRTVALVLFAVVTGIVSSSGTRAAAPVPKEVAKEADGDKAKFQGKWKVEALHMGGKDIMALIGQNFEMVVEFRGDQFTASANIGGMVQRTTATVKYGTPQARQLTTSNAKTLDADGRPIEHNQKNDALGYAFDGEKLLLGASNSGKAIDPLKPGESDIVIVLTRVKDK
jgi:uncharacterized protein (TIGR03067 family)